jgi:glycosyltransferase involved in cell wall biosynthesis
MLRTLVLAENLPYPTLKGGDLRTWQNVNALASLGPVGVFGLCSNDSRAAAKPKDGIEFWRSSSDPSLAYPLPANRKIAARAWFLDSTGHPADLYYSDAAAEEISRIMAEFEPHIAVIERLWLYRYISRVKRSGCRVVLDDHNVESVLYRQIGEAMSSRGDLQARLIRDAVPARTEAIEREASRAADQVWVCSRSDARLMHRLYPLSSPVRVVPNGLDLKAYDKAGKSSGSLYLPKEKSVVFPATFSFAPNAKAALFLIEEVLPRLNAIEPDFRLLLVGNSPTPEMVRAAQQDARIVVTGAVPEVRPYIASASAMVAPLFQGSGTRFKILEAFASRTPVISTAIGAEGLSVKPGIHLLFAESASDFVDGLRQLWENKPMASRLAGNGFDLVKQSYSWEAAGSKIRRAVRELCSSGTGAVCASYSGH